MRRLRYRSQSPNHMGSWSLSENARAVVLTPLVLRCASKDNFFRPQFCEHASVSLSVLYQTLSVPTHKLIVKVLAEFTYTISAVSTNSPISQGQVRDAVMRGRFVFQWLTAAASSISLPQLERFSVVGNGM